MSGWADFSDLDRYYPGSTQRIKRHTPEEGEQGWTDFVLQETVGLPKIYTVNGKDVEFYTVGQLAQALGRKAVTIRKWENDGVIPVATFNAPSDDPRGRRRLYTKEQVVGMVQIAKEEGILTETWKPINKTDFSKRVKELFERLLNESS